MGSVPLVLIIEDQADWRRRFRRYCKDEGYEVKEAQNADKAASLLERATFDAIITDIRLVDWQDGNKDGLDVLGSVPEEKRPAAVVVTGYPRPDFVRTAFKDYQVIDVLWKSDFDKAKFLKAVKEAVEATRRKL